MFQSPSHTYHFYYNSFAARLQVYATSRHYAAQKITSPTKGEVIFSKSIPVLSFRLQKFFCRPVSRYHSL